MAFKNLLERFEADMDTLYGKYSIKDGRGGQHSNHPIMETKPNNPNKRNFGADTRLTPLNSIAADFTRMSTWSRLPEGLMWYLNQQNLQSGNTFGETRVINPLFVIGNVQPYAHIKRPLATSTGEDLSGDSTNRSPASDARMGSAGRLQKSTSNHITRLITTGTQRTLYQRILSVIPPNPYINIVGDINSVTDIGILGVNERPEFSLNAGSRFSNMYSVAVWQGFHAASNPADNIQRIGNALRRGNIPAAVSAGQAAVNDVVRDIGQIGQDIVNSAVGGLLGLRSTPRNVSQSESNARGTDMRSLDGLRYFILGENEVSRYLKDTIDYTGKYPVASVGFLNRNPLIFGDELVTIPITSNTTPAEEATSPPAGAIDVRSVRNTAQSLFTRLQSPQSISSMGRRFLGERVTLVTNRFSNAVNDAVNINLLGTRTTQAAKNEISSGKIPGGNVVEDKKMEFPNLSLHQRYEPANANDDRIKFIRDNLQLQKERWLATMSPENIPSRDVGAGFEGGISINGTEVRITPNSKYPMDIRLVNGKRSYFSDGMTAYGVSFPTDGPQITGTQIDEMRTGFAKPLVDLFFFDYFNRKAIPFRAFITGLTEAVQPEYVDNFYIGRTERNVVYVGARRNVTFTLLLHAFNSEELGVIWKKLNYLTALCFPANYSNGFMVPPLVKLTLGDVYNNQPGFISSLTHNIDDATPWEITPEMQVPHGITVNISFSIIEKRQQTSYGYGDNVLPDLPLYNFGKSRTIPEQPNSLPPAPVIPTIGAMPGITPGAGRIDPPADALAVQGPAALGAPTPPPTPRARVTSRFTLPPLPFAGAGGRGGIPHLAP